MPTDTDKNDRPKPSLLSKASVKEKGKGVRKVEKKRKRGQTIAWFVLVDDLEKGGRHGVSTKYLHWRRAQTLLAGIHLPYRFYTHFIPVVSQSRIQHPISRKPHCSLLAPRAMNPSFRLITNHQSLITDSALRPVGRTIYRFVLSNNEFV